MKFPNGGIVPESRSYGFHQSLINSGESCIPIKMGHGTQELNKIIKESIIETNKINANVDHTRGEWTVKPKDIKQIIKEKIEVEKESRMTISEKVGRTIDLINESEYIDEYLYIKGDYIKCDVKINLNICEFEPSKKPFEDSFSSINFKYYINEVETAQILGLASIAEIKDALLTILMSDHVIKKIVDVNQ